MTLVDLLSDTTYREQAVKQLDQLLSSSAQFPVKTTQIYGLRQIARQQPGEVERFARHQGERAEKLDKQAEINFWALVTNLCSDSPSGWSVLKEGQLYLPVELQNIPNKWAGMTQDEQRKRNKLVRDRKERLNQWKNEHIPAFFERFCTHCLYRIAKLEMQVPNEALQQSQQEESESQAEGTMQAAFQQANLIE